MLRVHRHTPSRVRVQPPPCSGRSDTAGTDPRHDSEYYRVRGRSLLFGLCVCGGVPQLARGVHLQRARKGSHCLNGASGGARCRASLQASGR